MQRLVESLCFCYRYFCKNPSDLRYGGEVLVRTEPKSAASDRKDPCPLIRIIKVPCTQRDAIRFQQRGTAVSQQIVSKLRRSQAEGDHPLGSCGYCSIFSSTATRGGIWKKKPWHGFIAFQAESFSRPKPIKKVIIIQLRFR